MYFYIFPFKYFLNLILYNIIYYYNNNNSKYINKYNVKHKFQ